MLGFNHRELRDSLFKFIDGECKYRVLALLLQIQMVMMLCQCWKHVNMAELKEKLRRQPRGL